MPNLAEVQYKCIGDKKEVKQLYKILQDLQRRKTALHPNGWGGNMWLGCLLIKMGFNWEEHRCCGEIVDFQMDGDVLNIYQSTAWCEQEGVRECIQKKFPSITVYYREEEPGCDLFDTNSFEHYPDRYFLDSYDEPMYFETIEEAQKYIETLVGHPVEATFDALDAAVNEYQEEQEEKGIDCFWALHEFTEVDD